jgi:hypothetical protein
VLVVHDVPIGVPVAYSSHAAEAVPLAPPAIKISDVVSVAVTWSALGASNEGALDHTPVDGSNVSAALKVPSPGYWPAARNTPEGSGVNTKFTAYRAVSMDPVGVHTFVAGS